MTPLSARAAGAQRSAKILLTAYHFHPSVGGIETSTAAYAGALVRRGYQVTVVTNTPGEVEGYGYPVVRQPSRRELRRLWQASDLVWQNHLSLRLWGWALLSKRRPVVVTHATWLAASGPWEAALRALRRLGASRAQNVFVSDALRKPSGLTGPVIPNAYNDAIFRRLPGAKRSRDIIFVGRLVQGKGADILVEALGRLQSEDIAATATFVGPGPQAELRQRVLELGLVDRVRFTGSLAPEAIAVELNQHKILAVPSEWREPFGIVALEGAACGCVLVGTEGGGLPEAVGPSGPIVKNGDIASLANALGRLLTETAYYSAFSKQLDRHSAAHTLDEVIGRYDELFQALIARDRARRRGPPQDFRTRP